MNTPAPHPGLLTLANAELYVRVMVSPRDPYQLDVVVKPFRDIDQTLLSLGINTLARAVRSGHAVDLISTLTLTFQGSVASLFTRTRHVASFLDLELREDYCGKGLGWMLGLELMQVVERRYGAGLFLFRPLPLQALDGRSRARDAMHGDFRRHRYRIARAAAKYWHARKLPGSPDHMVIVGAPLAGATMVTGRTWWYLR